VCRLRGLDKAGAFSRMSVARAFTAYQLDSLINEGLEGMVRDGGATAVMVSCILDLFFDKDMHWSESLQLIGRCVETLGRLARECGVLVFATNCGLAKMHRRRALSALMYSAPRRIVRFEGAPGGLRVVLPREGRAMLFRPVPVYQTVLDQYFLLYGRGHGHGMVDLHPPGRRRGA
jgi:hypothetical protein